MLIPLEDTPNIVVIMNDDVGYGAPDTFGGPIHTPTLSKIASHGVTGKARHPQVVTKSKSPVN